jgi:hypothetical protein
VPPLGGGWGWVVVVVVGFVVLEVVVVGFVVLDVVVVVGVVVDVEVVVFSFFWVVVPQALGCAASAARFAAPRWSAIFTSPAVTVPASRLRFAAAVLTPRQSPSASDWRAALSWASISFALVAGMPPPLEPHEISTADAAPRIEDSRTAGSLGIAGECSDRRVTGRRITAARAERAARPS